MNDIILDTIDSSRQTQGTVTTFDRGGVIENMDTTGSPADFLVMAENLLKGSALIVNGAGTHPTQTNLFYMGAQITGRTFNSVQFKAQYSTFQGSNQSVYLINDSSYETSIETNFVPGSGTLLQFNYEDPGGDPKKSFQPQNALFRFPATIDKISVTRTFVGDGDADRRNKTRWMNKVNGAPWYGLPIGYWRVNEYSVQVSRYQGQYVRTVSAVSKSYQDWSERQAIVSSHSGYSAPTDDATAAAINALPYKYDIINDSTVPTAQQSKKCGLLRVGPFMTDDLTALFGFSR